MRNWIVLAVSLATLVGAGPFAVAEEPDSTPAIDRCRTFCARVFGEIGRDHDECALACDDADGCHRDCKQKFGEDQKKKTNCLRACMRRKEPAPPPADAPGEAPVRL